MKKKAKISLAITAVSFLALVVWVMSEIVLASKHDAFDFDIFDEDN